MLIELARYTMLFALTAVGLQTVLLAPTLWSGGSAVAIKLGFRQACFSAALTFFSFCVLLWAFGTRDFSVAAVFENFDARSGGLYALQAFCSSREGFFFIFIVILSAAFQIGFSAKDLATYQERGRYLFAAGVILFSLTALMLATADPFVRIDEPPFDGAGFPAAWRPAHKTLEVLLIFAAGAALTVSFVKTVCMHSKGRAFAVPAFRCGLVATACLTGAAGMKLMTGFTTAENGALWHFTADNSLLLAILTLAAGQTVLLYFRIGGMRVFTGWVLTLSLMSAAFSAAYFFAGEYRLFVLSADEVYFPNPVAALCAFTAFTCFLLFLCSVAGRRTPPDAAFDILSRETFAGMAVAVLTAAGFSVGALSLLPALFMFLPDLPLRLLPALFAKVLSGSVVAAAVLFFIASKRRRIGGGGAAVRAKTESVFWGLFLPAACLCLWKVQNGAAVVLFALPSVLILNAFFTERTFTIPSSFPDAVRTLREVRPAAAGGFLCAAGAVVFSVALAFSLYGGEAHDAILPMDGETDLPCRIERLDAKSGGRLICSGDAGIVGGKAVFQWPERKLNARVLQMERFTFRLTELKQTAESELTVRSVAHPLLPLAGTGLFMVGCGLAFLFLSVKRGAVR